MSTILKCVLALFTMFFPTLPRSIKQEVVNHQEVLSTRKQNQFLRTYAAPSQRKQLPQTPSPTIKVTYSVFNDGRTKNHVS